MAITKIRTDLSLKSIVGTKAGLVGELSKGAAVRFTLSQRAQLSVTGSSILASVSNSEGGENLFSKSSRR